VAFDAKEKTVDTLFQNVVYVIPRNQRRYVWTNQNWTDMYEDILLVSDGISTSHFIGSIVLKDEGKDDGLPKYTVIDGQQRIITLTIILTAIMFTMKKRNMLDDFGGTDKYLVAKDIKNKFREIVYPEYHLSLPKIVNSVLKMEQNEIEKKSITAFSNHCTISVSKDKNIIDCFKFFASKFESLDNEFLLKVRDAVINIGYVNIISTTDEDSYTIFEILNARGLDLEDHELLKNYIMRYMHPIELRDDAKRIWEEIENNLGRNIQPFLRHYAIHKYNYDRKRDITVYKEIQNVTKGRNVDRLLDDIKIKSDYYTQFYSPSEENPIEYKVFTFFRQKRVGQFRPLLLSLMHQKASENLTIEKYNSTLQFLCNFFICYKIIGEENSNMLSDSVYKSAYILENEYANEKLDECIRNLKSKLPTLESFTNSFKNVGWSNYWGIYKNTKNKDRCKIVLELIEEHVSNRTINIDVTIEHILPDSNSIENAQIGNLFFLEENLNRRCKDKPLLEKHDIYNESSLMCPRSFVQRYSDKEFIPYNRTEFLAKLIYNNILNISEQ